MITDRRADARGARAPPHHRIRVGLRQWRRAELPGTTCDGAEQRPFRIAADPGAVQIRVLVRLERAMTGHLVTLAVLFPRTDPQPPVLHVHIVHAHRERGAHPCERKHHQRDQRAVAQPRGRRHINAVEQLPRLDRVEHRRLALFRGMTGTAYRRGRIVRHDLARH